METTIEATLQVTYVHDEFKSERWPATVQMDACDTHLVLDETDTPAEYNRISFWGGIANVAASTNEFRETILHGSNDDLRLEFVFEDGRIGRAALLHTNLRNSFGSHEMSSDTVVIAFVGLTRLTLAEAVQPG